MASILSRAARSTGSRVQLKDDPRRQRKDGKSPRRHAQKARLRAARTAPPHSRRTSASHENGRGSRDNRSPLAKLCLPSFGNEQSTPTSSRYLPFSAHAAMFIGFSGFRCAIATCAAYAPNCAPSARNACGVIPVHFRNARWNAFGSRYPTR